MYEGFPNHYFKKDVPVQVGGREVSAMVYVMNLRMNFNLPSPSYYSTVYQGYRDCGLDTSALEQASPAWPPSRKALPSQKICGGVIRSAWNPASSTAMRLHMGLK